MSGFTPGPWHATGYRGAVISVCKGFPQSPVAKAEGRESTAEREANARLIAAAPDLLAVLAEYLVLGAGKCTIGKPLADKALAAVRKARGQP